MSSERRFSARVLTDLDAEVINDRGERTQGRLCNLSLGGLSLLGDANLQQVVRQLQTAPGAPFTPVEVQVAFLLPADDGRVPVALSCRHLHTRRVARDVFELGFKILGTEGDRPAALGAYLRRFSGVRR
jgi:hypothetical protein